MYVDKGERNSELWQVLSIRLDEMGIEVGAKAGSDEGGPRTSDEKRRNNPPAEIEMCAYIPGIETIGR